MAPSQGQFNCHCETAERGQSNVPQPPSPQTVIDILFSSSILATDRWRIGQESVSCFCSEFRSTFPSTPKCKQWSQLIVEKVIKKVSQSRRDIETFTGELQPKGSKGRRWSVIVIILHQGRCLVVTERDGF